MAVLKLVVEQLTYDPMLKGSNPITAETRRKQQGKSFENTKPMAVVKLVEQLTYDPMFKGSNPIIAETWRREWEKSFENPNPEDKEANFQQTWSVL